MSHSESKTLVLGVLAGAAGISFALLWWKGFRKQVNVQHLLRRWSSANNSAVVQDNHGASVVLHGRQLQILEKIGNLLESVEELKEDVKYLKDTIPKLEKQIRDELRGKNEHKKASPQHKRKKTESTKGEEEYPSSEEGEGGYLTAHTDTETESEGEQASQLRTKRTGAAEEEVARLREILDKADKSHAGCEAEKQEGFKMLLDNKDKREDCVEFLWRLARAYGDMYFISNDNEEKKTYAAEGKCVAGKAVDLNNSSAESHRWFAIMCGYMSEFDTVQNKIKNGYLFKEHLDKAIELSPQDPLQYYLLGRWCYAVSQLSWIERKVAATLFGNPPTSTIEEALHNFLKVEEMHPGYSKYNYVFLAKCYKDLGQKATALKYCKNALAIASITKEDSDAQKDLEVLMASLSP
ncbi:regulator of microtubule dynamics protein 2 [Spea bombifrons]|uniref:regulator of microtubule dynamics protein 2 n=1 Tax=Spea bombifrons TaxID=233779 RepID=UPI00234A3FDC|nr:regulator of microtubule dynamics protein 2 [Spea bombifrons]